MEALDLLAGGETSPAEQAKIEESFAKSYITVGAGDMTPCICASRTGFTPAYLLSNRVPLGHPSWGPRHDVMFFSLPTLAKSG